MRGKDQTVRVLFWSEQFWPTIGGVEVWTSRLLPTLEERGYEFIVVTSHGSLDLPDTATYKGIPVYRFPFWTAITNSDIDLLMRLKGRIGHLKRSFAPHLVHFSLTGPSAYFQLLTAHAYPVPLLISLHDLSDSLLGGPDTLFGRTLLSGDWVNSFSAVVLAEARRLVPEITPHSSVIYHGRDAPALPPRPLPFDPPRLLCLGRLVHEKGFDLAVGAFSALSSRFPGLRLAVASDGPARPILERQVAELGLTDRVDFLGWIEFEKMPALLNSATMIVMPSRLVEGFGLVALEAALMARPVVATRVGALPEVIVDGHTGVLVERDDSHALAEAIAHLLDRPELATRMGEAARRRAQELFSSKRHADAFDALYRRLIQQAAPTNPAAFPAAS
jgi:glycosyltransferase involved in cell wall biosynthesis